MDGAVKRTWSALRDLYPMGLSMLWKAPLVLGVVAIPEFAQHVVEIQLGMFDGGEATSMAANAPLRWVFGYVKVAGLFLAILAAARFWWSRRAGRAWYDPRDLAWKRLVAGALLFLGVPLLPLLAKGQISDMAIQIISLVLTIPLLPALFVMVGGLCGDRTTTLREYWRRSWGWTLLVVALMAIAFWPAAQLHRWNHMWAMHASPALVWLLMIFDSVVVGLIAGLCGTALYLSYNAFERGSGAE